MIDMTKIFTYFAVYYVTIMFSFFIYCNES